MKEHYHHECEDCGHKWTSKKKDPKVCQKCKSKFWNNQAFYWEVKGKYKDGSLKLGKKKLLEKTKK